MAPLRESHAVRSWIVQVEETIARTRQAVAQARAAGGRIGLVPTMGALHRGHRALLDAARRGCDFLVISIFVNPKQFAPGEDLQSYPRPLEQDVQTCREAGVDLVFAPSPAEMYPPGFNTMVRVAGLTEGLCGATRPGHFDGVTTVVARLFSIIEPEVAWFGEKDYQQLMVVRRMVSDLDMPIDIVGHPTVRDADGLATSSRNTYLDAESRVQACSIYQALCSAVEHARAGETKAAVLIAMTRTHIEQAGPCTIDYVCLVDARTLASLESLDRPARLCAAVRIGSCRLIDNVAVDVPPLDR